MKPKSIPPRVQEKMAGKTSSNEGVLTDFLTPILSKISGELTREAMIELHQLISGNSASMMSNLGRGRHGDLMLTMTSDEYMAHKDYTFVPPHNPGS